MLRKKKPASRFRWQATDICVIVMLYMLVLGAGVALYQQSFAYAKTTEAVTDNVLLIETNTLPVKALQDRGVAEPKEAVEAARELAKIQKFNEKKLKKIEKSREKREARWKAERARKRAIRREKKRLARMKELCGVAVNRKEQAVLERIVQAEAGGEDLTGKLLVANVVLNRVRSSHFPSTVSKVVFAHSGSRYQFSPISDGRYYTVTVSKETKKAVRMALRGNNPSKGALYFMARRYASPSNVRWFDTALTKVVSHGVHEFYR